MLDAYCFTGYSIYVRKHYPAWEAYGDGMELLFRIWGSWIRMNPVGSVRPMEDVSSCQVSRDG